MRKNRTISEEEKCFLKDYNPRDYERPSVTSDVLLFSMIDSKLNVLLIKRKGHPFKGYWAIPGGFVGIKESAEEAAYRELYEETGIARYDSETNTENVYLEQLYTFSDVDRDPRMRVISVVYIALVSGDKLTITAGVDASDVDWFPVNDLLDKIKNEDILAFDHEEIFKLAIKRLRGKVFYTDIATQMLPDEFTIRELCTVFEEILNTKLLYANFHRDMSQKLIPTGKFVMKAGRRQRPAELYRRNYDIIEDDEDI